jgi:endonuclease YncB( thermonuclease family)
MIPHLALQPMPAAARFLKRARIFQRFSGCSRKADREPATSSPHERRIPAFGLGPRGVHGGLAERVLDSRIGGGIRGDEIARGRVGKIVDGRTFVLDDGREVRLAAIEVAPLAAPQDRADRAGPAAAAALGALAGGDQVVLRRAEDGSDRYGRLFAYAHTLQEGDEFLLQQELVAEGFARVSTRIANPCAGHLLDRERAAREAKLGLWPDPYYEVLNAETPQDALAQRGRFALIEGKVGSVRVNFGRRRFGDITVTILKRNERSFAGRVLI